MIERNRISILLLSLLGATAALSACSERTSRTAQETISVTDASSDLPEIVITAHAVAEPLEEPRSETVQASKPRVPADIDKSEATPSRAHARNVGSDETG